MVDKFEFRNAKLVDYGPLKSNMEELPKKLNKREANITPKVMQWFFDNYPYDVCVELKIGKKTPKPHQDAALNAVKDGRFKYKIPDMGRTNPFDFIVLKTKKVHAIWCMYYPKEKQIDFWDITTGQHIKANI